MAHNQSRVARPLRGAFPFTSCCKMSHLLEICGCIPRQIRCSSLSLEAISEPEWTLFSSSLDPNRIRFVINVPCRDMRISFTLIKGS